MYKPIVTSGDYSLLVNIVDDAVHGYCKTCTIGWEIIENEFPTSNRINPNKSKRVLRRCVIIQSLGSLSETRKNEILECYLKRIL